MKTLLLTMMITLSFTTIAGENKIKGADASKLYNQVMDSYPSDWEGSCGMGRCWVKGNVVCETNITDGVRKSKTTCTINPSAE